MSTTPQPLPLWPDDVPDSADPTTTVRSSDPESGVRGARRARRLGPSILDRPDIEVRRSERRRRSVTAYREGGRTIVVVPHRMSRSDVITYVEDLVGRLEAREQRAVPSDAQLARRAEHLIAEFLPGWTTPRSVRWSSTQRQRWGSCTPVDRSIRLSARLRSAPSYVVDYVLMHEVVHLEISGHNADFHAAMAHFPGTERAQAFLAGMEFAAAHAPVGDVDDGAVDTH